MSQTGNPIREIQTEHPFNEIWSMLGFFESRFNCQKYLENKFDPDLACINDSATNLSHTVSTAQEFYKAADGVSVLTRPLLLFYGMIDLAKTLFIATHGKKSPSRAHGLRIVKGWNGQISELSVNVIRDGTFPQFHGCYCKDSLYNAKFTLKELFSQIPEIKTEFETIYNEKSRALLTSRGEYGPMLIDSELTEYTNLDSLLTQIPGFTEKYRIMGAGTDNRFIVGQGMGASEVMTRSISGDKYFVLPLEKETVISVPEMSVHYMIMYLLGMLVRYHPEEWGKMIKGEETGEMFILNKFLTVTKRKFPNLVLNELLDREFHFVSTSLERSQNTRMSRRQLENIYDYVNRKMMDKIRGFR